MPLKIIFFILLCGNEFLQAKQFLVMIDPAGDIQHTGRSIADHFERGISMSCASAIKQRIEELNPYVTVILTKMPGELVSPMHGANFANRISVDLYISLNFFYQPIEIKPTIYFYYFLRDRHNDFLNNQITRLSLIPIYDSYRYSLSASQKIVEHMMMILQNNNPMMFQLKGAFGIPFKPLIGVIRPACGIEIGLKSYQDWKVCVEPLAMCVIKIIEGKKP
jgi:hypothetical protein